MKYIQNWFRLVSGCNCFIFSLFKMSTFNFQRKLNRALNRIILWLLIRSLIYYNSIVITRLINYIIWYTRCVKYERLIMGHIVVVVLHIIAVVRSLDRFFPRQTNNRNVLNKGIVICSGTHIHLAYLPAVVLWR